MFTGGASFAFEQQLLQLQVWNQLVLALEVAASEANGCEGCIWIGAQFLQQLGESLKECDARHSGSRVRRGRDQLPVLHMNASAIHRYQAAATGPRASR
jgi:hypothetical protein